MKKIISFFINNDINKIFLVDRFETLIILIASKYYVCLLYKQIN